MTSDDKPQRRRRGHNEGTIGQRADGRWWGRIDLGYVNGKRRRKAVYGETRREVADKLKALLAQQQRGVNIAPQRQTVTQFLEGWITDVVEPNERPATVSKYQQYIRLYFVPHIGRIALAKLTPQHVQGLIRSLQDHGLAPGTIRRVITMLRVALGVALRYELVSRNVATLVDVPEDSPAEARVLTFVEAERLLKAAAGDRLHALWLAALLLGLRQGELLGLRWQDVDTEAEQLTINQQVIVVAGKRMVGPPKTPKSRRSLPLPAVLIQALRTHRTRQLEERLLAGSRWQDHGLVFSSSIGTPMINSNLLMYFKRLLKQADVPDMTFHQLRHSCSTFLAALDVDMRTAMSILGHTNAPQTLRYTHAVDERTREAVAKLGQRFEANEEVG